MPEALTHVPHPRVIPDREALAHLPLFPRLELSHISVIDDAPSAGHALAALMQETVLGFDTESKPTFKVGDVSSGPHVLQLATSQHAWLFLLHDAQVRSAAATLLIAPHIVKAGFGLGDDLRHIQRKLGVEPRNVLEINAVFRKLGYRKDMGVKAAVAVMFNQRFIKSKKVATTNWANPRLTPAQVIYAANDAYAAMRVVGALRADEDAT
jgi:ribonuclease D